MEASASRHLPWHNISYRRELLLDYGTDLAAMLLVEGVLLDDLEAKGHGLFFEPAARTSHVNISLFSSWISHTFWGGRLFGGTRARKKKWSVWRRLLYICGGPLIPPLRLWRTLPKIYLTGRQRELMPRILPAMFAGLIPHAIGEVIGYALGSGNAELRYSFYEMKRTRHITERDRQQDLVQDGLPLFETEFKLTEKGVAV